MAKLKIIIDQFCLAFFYFCPQSGQNNLSREMELSPNCTLQQTGLLGSGTQAAEGRLFSMIEWSEKSSVKKK
jgi:hypothetical protein